MQTYEKLNVLAKLVVVGQECPTIENEMLAMIAKIASPQPTISAMTNKPAGTASGRQPISPTLDELCLARAVGKIPAIKSYRVRTGFGLKEAKDTIEKAMAHIGWMFNGLEDYRNPGHPTHVFEDIEPIPF